MDNLTTSISGASRSANDAKLMATKLQTRFHGDVRLISAYNIHLGTNNELTKLTNDILITYSGYVVHKGKKVDSMFLIEQYKLNGLKLLDDLDGSFFMTIITPTSCYILRDGAGRRTGYYHLDKNGDFFFSNEPKSIRLLDHFEKEVDPASLYKYLTFSFVPGKDTMLKGISELRLGELIEYSDKSCSSSYYYNVSDEKKDLEQSSTAWDKGIIEAIDDDIKTGLSLSKRPGVFLSGGLDSSIIASRVSRLMDTPLPTYCIHFGKKYQSELEFAALVAKKYKTEHQDFLIQPKNFVPIFEEVIDALDEPIGDPITIPNYLLAQRAAQDCDAIFNGEGGDPCFGGPKNYEMFLSQWYQSESNPLEKEQAYLTSYRRGYEYLELILNKSYNQNQHQSHVLENLISPYFKLDNLNFLDQLMTINIKEKGAHLILPKVERMLSYAGINSFSPMFSKEVVSMSMRMKSTLKLYRGDEKIILKSAYKNDLPDEIINRPKSGMRVPVHFWFQGEMKKFAKKHLLSSHFLDLGYFDPDGIKNLLKYDNEDGLRRHGLLIWILLTFAVWHKNVFDK